MINYDIILYEFSYKKPFQVMPNCQGLLSWGHHGVKYTVQGLPELICLAEWSLLLTDRFGQCSKGP